ncbi:MAG: PTS transporter subunit EIIC [Sebaldella sp.]|nr:PTS transporter subunit EIIC [Sebaldella sp.]
MNYKDSAEKILLNLGGKNNVQSFTNCMTRLRVELKDSSLVNVKEIKDIKGVLGVVEGEQAQIIVGPGHAQRLREAFGQISGISDNSEFNGENINFESIADETKEKVKSKQKSPLQRGLKHVGNIFIPLIPGFVGTGLILAIANVWKIIDPSIVGNSWYSLFAAAGMLLLASLNVLVGHNASKEFGGTPVLGAIAGGLIMAPALAGLPEQPLTLFNGFIKLSPNLGGVIGVIFAAFMFSYIEKKLRKIIPASLDLFFIPFLTILIGGIITIIIIMPIAALIMKFITWLLVDIMLNSWGAIGGYILAASFLPLVMLGIHQGLTPIHIQLIQTQGYTVLLPILAMAGGGQVGAALAILVKTKNKKLKETIKSALPIGFLGIGEPLIYGVSLPLFYPFITACLGAGFGGMVLAAVNNVGALAFGPSGILLVTLIANGKWMWYLIALLTSYLGGFILTYLFGYNEKMLERLD